jgi:hypothetical protein
MGSSQSYIIGKDRLEYNNPTNCNKTISLLLREHIPPTGFPILDNKFLRPMVNSPDEQLIHRNKELLNRLYNYFIDNERALCKDYRVFYSSWSCGLQILTDVMYVHDKIIKNEKLNIRTKKLRNDIQHQTVQDFFNSEYFNDIKSNQAKFYEWGDHEDYYRNHFICANFSLFNNIGHGGEDSYMFFTFNRNMSVANLDLFLNKISAAPEKKTSFRYGINKIMENYFTGVFGVYNQIFIPLNEVNNIVYLSVAYGLPILDVNNNNTNEILDLMYQNKIDDAYNNNILENFKKIHKTNRYLAFTPRITDLQVRILAGDIFEKKAIIFSSDSFISNKILYYNELSILIKELIS